MRRIRVKLTGELPSPLNPPSGCASHNRCRFAEQMCSEVRPPLEEQRGRLAACHFVEKAMAAG
jgi:dipeptide transport system ATP-binding protein